MHQLFSKAKALKPMSFPFAASSRPLHEVVRDSQLT